MNLEIEEHELMMISVKNMILLVKVMVRKD